VKMLSDTGSIPVISTMNVEEDRQVLFSRS